MTTPLIRPVRPGDEDAWRSLWSGYLAFYRADVSDAATAATWARIHDPDSPVHARVAEADGLIGLCHFLYHETTWAEAPVCYLQDLFVAPEGRGSGAARALIRAVEAEARDRGAAGLYWMTQEYNAPARSLYDTIVPRSSFIIYEMAFD